MYMEKRKNLTVTTSPHVLDNSSTTKIMADVVIALLPATVVACMVFGLRAVFLTAICVFSCVGFEYLFRRISNRDNTITDLSAGVTGLLLAFNLPANFPYWMAIIGSFIAIVIVKQIFGGIGQNFANPAITARVVLLVSFTGAMTDWPKPTHIALATDAVTGPTPLGLLQAGEISQLPSHLHMLLGSVGGSLGETSALALLVGGAYLLIKRVITPTIPVTFIGTVAVMALIVGQDPIFHILAGGVILGAFFMATDYTTSPMTMGGQMVFGIGCGFITMMIRLYGSYPEGVSFAILLMNIIVPHIDRLSGRKLYGGMKRWQKQKS